MPSLPTSPLLHLLSPATLPTTPTSLSILTYNVLLPNSQDGWWNYKMYSPSTTTNLNNLNLNLNLNLTDDDDDNTNKPDDITTWTYRQKLLQNRIAQTNPDIVCFQEVSPTSFASDFAFMKDELGYDGMALFRKGRFRPATFWREGRWKLAEDVVHRDRTLLTVFQPVDGGDDGGGEGGNWHVLNCHLQAGFEGKRRVRQIDDGVKASLKAAKRLKELDPTNPSLIVCGDFNGGSDTGAVRYLEDGRIGPEFLEDGIPVSSKDKICPLSKPMIDVASQKVVGRVPPPTLVVNELISLMIEKEEEEVVVGEGEEGGDDGGVRKEYRARFVPDILERLERAYGRYASHPSDEDDSDGEKMVMNCKDVERWLIDINKQLGRGSEFRTAAKEMGWVAPPPPEPIDDTTTTTTNEIPKAPRITLPPNGILSLCGFQNVYLSELHGGKYWGIAYDLAIMGEALPTDDLFTARFDRMYYHGVTIEPIAVLDTVADGHCPSDVEPSDHLPVGATFKRIRLGDGGVTE